jgi:hypothetical protein
VWCDGCACDWFVCVVGWVCGVMVVRVMGLCVCGVMGLWVGVGVVVVCVCVVVGWSRTKDESTTS